MKEFEPSFIALQPVKIQNYRVNPATNTLNPKVADINGQLHQYIKN